MENRDLSKRIELCSLEYGRICRKYDPIINRGHKTGFLLTAAGAVVGLYGMFQLLLGITSYPTSLNSTSPQTDVARVQQYLNREKAAEKAKSGLLEWILGSAITVAGFSLNRRTNRYEILKREEVLNLLKRETSIPNPVGLIEILEEPSEDKPVRRTYLH